MSDPFFNDVVLLTLFNGDPEADYYTSEIGPDPQFFGGAEIDETHSIFAGSSVIFNHSTDDYIQYPGDYDFLHDGSTDFTIDGFVEVGSGESFTFGNTNPALDSNVPFITIGRGSGSATLFVMDDTGSPVVFLSSSSTDTGVIYVGLKYEVGVGYSWWVEGVQVLSGNFPGAAPSDSHPGPLTVGPGVFWLHSYRITKNLRDLSVIPLEEFSFAPPVNAYMHLPSPLDGQVTIVGQTTAGYIQLPNPLLGPKIEIYNDFSPFVVDVISHYYLEITGDPILRLEISSWQATRTLQRKNYLQAVIPNHEKHMSELAARRGSQEIIVYREANLASGRARVVMARVPLDEVIPTSGPFSASAVLSGHTDRSEPPAIPETIVISKIRVDTSTTNSRSFRAAIDWFLRPGDIVEALGNSFTVDYINYYVNENGSHMQVGQRG